MLVLPPNSFFFNRVQTTAGAVCRGFSFRPLLVIAGPVCSDFGFGTGGGRQRRPWAWLKGSTHPRFVWKVFLHVLAGFGNRAEDSFVLRVASALMPVLDMHV